MKKEINTNKLPSQITFGFTAATLILSCCFCMCAVTGQGLIGVLLCSVVCTLSSLKLKKSVFTPDVFLIVPLFYVLNVSSPLCTALSVFSGSCIFIIIKKFIKEIKIPPCVIAGATLSLCLGTTILLTNSYFGIGATGETPFEMLKSFRYLGFHPNFRGLLYGTITLFTMITYPFKFRKLNKYLPAQFITLLIPFILNLILNPNKELTTINEVQFDSIVTSFQNFTSVAKDFSAIEISVLLKSALAFALILTGHSITYEKAEDKLLFSANALSGALSGLPLKAHSIRGYGKIAALTATAIITISVIFLGNIFSRLPLHCAGSMLIVFAWQSVPYKEVAKVFKSRRLLNILVFALGIPLFIFFEPFIATIFYLVLTLFFYKTKASLKRKEFLK